MLTRSSRKLPPDFNENQPVGRRLKLNPREERRQILVRHPTLPAAFPTLVSPPPRKERPLWSRDAARAANNENERKLAKNKRRRIDMTEDDLLMELLGDNTFLDAQIGCAEAELPLFGQGDYEAMFIPKYNEDDKIDLGLPILDDLNPGELDLPLFFDEDSSENWGLDIPASSSFKELASGVKMAIMIEAVAIYNIAKAPEALSLTADDIDDYVGLYDHEATNDAAHAYNIQIEEEWEMMHRMNGRTDFANYDPPGRRPTFRSTLSLIKRKDVDAGQRYLNMVGQTVLVNKLEDYVGCAAAGTFKFTHPMEQKRSVRASGSYTTIESMAGSDLGDNICVASTNEEDVVRDGRRFRVSATSSVACNSEVPVAKSRAMGPQALTASSPDTATTTAQAQNPAATAVAHHGSNWTKHNLDATPLLAQPPKRRRRLAQARAEQPKFSQLPSYEAVEDQQRERASPTRRQEQMPASVRAETPPPSATELVRDMSSNTCRNVSVISSPMRMAFAEQRRPRVAHLERPGQNPTRHSSGNGSSIVRTNPKMKRQLSGVYRPERQWAEQAHSSSPLRATTPRPATPRSGSKEYFLSEQRPEHPLSSPRLFDESGKTIREKPQTPEEVQSIFKMQEEEAKRQRRIHLGKVLPGEQWPPAFPSSTTSLGFQASLSTVKASAQRAAQDTAQQQDTPRRPEPILPTASITPGSYQRPFASQMKSKQASVQGPSMPAPVTPRKTDPILPPPRPALSEYRATYQSHVISETRSSQVGGPTSTSTSANNQSVQGPPNGASLSTPTLNGPPSQKPPQTAVQQTVMQQGPRPAGQPFMSQKPVGQRPMVLGSAIKAPAPRQKARRSKTTTAPPESTTGKLPHVKLDCGEKPVGQRPAVLGSAIKAPVPRQKARRSKTTTAPPESTAGRLSPVKSVSGEKPLGPAKLKSTYKQPPRTLSVERPIYQPPHVRMESGSHSTGYYQRPLPIPTNPQLPHNQAQPNTMKRAHSMLSSTNRDTCMAGPQLPPQLPRQQPGGNSYYNNSFAAHSKATFDRTIKDFTRDPPRGNHTNQFTKTKAANPLQGPQDFSAPSRGPKGGTPNNGGNASAHPNPFRNGSSSSQASPASSPAARLPPAGHAAQYYAHHPPQSRHLHQPYQPQQSPPKKQKVVHEPQGTPERPLWDRNNRKPSPAQPPPMMGSVAQTSFISKNGLGTMPQPNTPNGRMSSAMGVAASDAFTQAMKSNGVQLHGQLSQQAFGKKKRNVGAKVQASPPHTFPPQVTPLLDMCTGVFGPPGPSRNI